MRVLDVRIDNLTRKEILNKIESFLDEPHFHQIATINPEFILEAGNNPTFKNILNTTALNVADGVGIWFAYLRFGKFLQTRIAGADLMLEILKMAEKKNLKIFLAANKDGLSTWQETCAAILKIYPKLNISGDNIDTKNVSYRIPDTNCQILFCNFGAPSQELFINSQKCDTIRLAMGVGGSFDFLTGKVPRAPKFMRIIGLEWLWRTFQLQECKFKKQRLARIFRAVIVFPIRIVLNR